jgi:transcriptional regulator GlxA family with amidase domain
MTSRNSAAIVSSASSHEMRVKWAPPFGPTRRSGCNTRSGERAGRTIYTIEIATNASRRTVEGEGGVLTFLARHHFKRVQGACDSVLLVCGLGTRSVRDPALSAWLRKRAADTRRLGAVCVGAFLLAEAGLLDGRRATAHWKFGRELAARYPATASWPIRRPTTEP